MGHGECLRSAFPMDQPVRACTPSVTIHKKGIFGVVKEEFAVKTFYRNGVDFLPVHEIKRCVGLIKQRLCLKGFQANYFKATRTCDTQL